MQVSSVLFSFARQECLCSVEVLPGGHGAGEPVQAKCVRQLQEPSVGAGQDGSAVQGAAAQKGTGTALVSLIVSRLSPGLPVSEPE